MSTEIIRDTAFGATLEMHLAGHRVVLATVIKTSGSSPRPLGAQMAIRGDGYFMGSVSGGCVESAVIGEALELLKSNTSKRVQYGIKTDNPFDAGIACGGEIEIWLEPIGDNGIPLSMLQDLANAEKNEQKLGYQIDLSSGARSAVPTQKTQRDGEIFTLAIKLPKRLMIIGAVHIAQTLVPMAQAAGFDVTLIDNREIFGNAERFEGVRMVSDWPADVLNALKLDRGCAVVTLTHDDKFDIPALEVALKSDAFYIGALGSRQTQKTRNAELALRGFDAQQIHGPVGLDIGAKTPAEIAISIMAEIIQVMRQ